MKMRGIAPVCWVSGPKPCVSQRATAAFPSEVETETPLNEKTVTLALTTGGREMLISRPTGTVAPASGSTLLEMDAADAVLFDRETGYRIKPSDADNATDAAA